ncbi:MAG: 6-carboxytetrahydropterin synthase [Ignavibacteria bacterium]|nr:6-carboxytetrahydropterin synthase [Ignavibacteria bacterium]
MVYITRRETFSASHRLFNPELSDYRNDELFDKCNNIHGHNYILEVIVVGNIILETGYVVDLKILKNIISKTILEKVDHKHLNTDVDFLQGIIPTVENLCVAFWNQLVNKIPAGKLFSIKLSETENNFAEYRGE